MARQTNTAITVISKIGQRQVGRAAALVVIHGDDLGRKFDLNVECLTIGRGADSDIQVDQQAVSRRHAEVRSEEGRLLVEDLGSTNGTILNDEQVDAPTRLRNGDLLKIGRTIFKFIASNNIEAAYHDEIYRMTTVDGLTQIFNRRYFDDVLDRELSRARRYVRQLSLVLIDIDHFKKINDAFGHLAGDAVLKEVAGVIKSKTRREDVFARYGGEEFALLLPEIDARGAHALAEKVCRLVEKHRFVFDDVTIPVTVSAGVSTVQKKGELPEALIRRADEKLYAAKSGGRNRVA